MGGGLVKRNRVMGRVACDTYVTVNETKVFNGDTGVWSRFPLGMHWGYKDTVYALRNRGVNIKHKKTGAPLKAAPVEIDALRGEFMAVMLPAQRIRNRII